MYFWNYFNMASLVFPGVSMKVRFSTTPEISDFLVELVHLVKT
ncbi:hypothetical protein ZONE111904_16170 [Zobellia nedashkovskayae]